MDSRSRSNRMRKAMLALVLALAGLCAFAGIAQAASPAWKLLAATGPTNLPPKQSEIQRVTVEAEGGTFTLSRKAAEGEGTLSFASGKAELITGSNLAEIWETDEGAFEAGQSITGEGIPPGTTIVGFVEPGIFGPIWELSANSTVSSEEIAIQAGSKEVTGVTTSSGEFAVGEELGGEGFPAGTLITSVAGDSFTISNFPTASGVIELIATGTTVPLAFDASAADVQAAFDAMPGLDPDTVSVTGGPGGDAEHPYFVEFAGSLAEQNVEALDADNSSLAGEHANVDVFTVVPGGPGTGEISIEAANIGGAPTSGEYTVTLGSLPPGIVTSGPAKTDPESGWTCPGGGGESSVTCTSTTPVKSLTPPGGIKIPVEVDPTVASSADVPVTISGAGAGSASFELPIVVSRQQASAGTAAFWAGAFDEDGNEETQAGGHPYSAASYFLLKTVRSGSGKVVPVGDPRSVIVDLPPGFTGNPMVTPRCPQSQLTSPDEDTPACNAEMSIGNFAPIVSAFGASSQEFAFGIYNSVPAQGYAAEFTTRVAFPQQSLLASTRASEDYGVRITAPSNPTFYKIYGAFAAIEGFPAGAQGKAFLRNATDCAEMAREAPVVRTKSDTWQEPGNFSVTTTTVLPPVTGCEKLEFHPDFSFQPTSTQGSSGVGATAHLHLPQEGLSDPDKLGEPDLKKAVVTLPEGLTLNASAANGLQACSEDQIGLLTTNGALPNPIRFDEEAPSCPDGSKLGTARIDTPLLDQPIGGTIYLAEQDENPFGSLLAIYLVVESERFGLTIKLPGKVDIGSGGRMTATFDYNPQLPFEDLTLHFRGGGPRSELATPEVCGHYETTGSWTPWSAPESGPPAQTSHGFDVTNNCAPSPGARPFGPSFEAGTIDPIAGGYSPLVIKIGRRDGEQELRSLEFTMPPGFSGKLAGIPYCQDAAIAAAQSKSGKDERANPSCPAASRLGSVSASAGVGSEPFSVGGDMYLSGPYKGAPLSAVVITPAVAGPFDLGNVVIRSPLHIDPDTAQVSAKSDPIPTSLENIPLKVRQVAVNIDRPEFTLNPTSCEAMQIKASIASSDGATATPENRFQVGGCRDLSFEPKTYFRLYGGVGRGAHPKVRAVYIAGKAGEANLTEGAFTIPRSEFLEQAHIRTVCTRVQFAASACPKGAVYGHVKAFSPIVDYPVSGPVYLRSSDNELPDLVFDLHGPDYQPVHIAVPLRIDSIRGQIRATAESAPDLPVSKLIFVQQGGKKGLLVNSRNICSRPFRATVETEGHNGKRSTFKPVLRNSKCGKQRKSKRRDMRRGHR
jgi:hypothetical protein